MFRNATQPVPNCFSGNRPHLRRPVWIRSNEERRSRVGVFLFGRDWSWCKKFRKNDFFYVKMVFLTDFFRMQLFPFFESHHRFSKFALECSKWSLYLLLFLLPIFFLPWTLDILEINKQTLFILLTSVSLLAWLGAMVSAKRMFFHFHISIIFLPLLFLSALISTFFNKTGFLSLVGHASQEYTSVLTLFFGCMFFFLILNLAKEEGFLQKSLHALFASSILVALIGLSSFLGWFFLPFDFARAQTFNTIGTVNSLGIFLGLMLILANSFWVFQKKRPGMLLGILTLLSLLVLFMIDYWLIWMIVLIGFSALFLMGFLYAHELISTRRF